MKLRRDPKEQPNADWSVGYFRWVLTAPCGVCGCMTTGKTTGTEEEVRRCVNEKRWLCRICEARGETT